MTKYKHYWVDDIILTVLADKDMTGYREVPNCLLKGGEPCAVLVELYMKAKRGKENGNKKL